MSKLRKQDLDGNVETIILSVLDEGPSYGYAILKDINSKAEGVLKFGEGTIYPVLHRMEDKELISSKWGKCEKTGRKRKYYRITPKGRKLLADNREYWKVLVGLMGKFAQESETGELLGGMS